MFIDSLVLRAYAVGEYSFLVKHCEIYFIVIIITTTTCIQMYVDDFCFSSAY